MSKVSMSQNTHQNKVQQQNKTSGETKIQREVMSYYFSSILKSLRVSQIRFAHTLGSSFYYDCTNMLMLDVFCPTPYELVLPANSSTRFHKLTSMGIWKSMHLGVCSITSDGLFMRKNSSKRHVIQFSCKENVMPSCMFLQILWLRLCL